MKRWNVLPMAVLGLMFAGMPAMAQDSDDEDDEANYLGCRMLGIGVGAAILSAGTGTGANAWTAGLSAALAAGLSHTSKEYCNYVTEETVDAYENAMNNLGIQILWHTYYDPSMDWCLSIRPYDCLPYIPPEENPDPNQQLFVELAWEAARSTAEQLVGNSIDNAAYVTTLALSNALQSGFENSGIDDGLAPLAGDFSDPFGDASGGID